MPSLSIKDVPDDIAQALSLPMVVAGIIMLVMAHRGPDSVPRS